MRLTSWFAKLATLITLLGLVAAAALALDLGLPDQTRPGEGDTTTPGTLSYLAEALSLGEIITDGLASTRIDPTAGATSQLGPAPVTAPTAPATTSTSTNRINILCLGLDNLDPKATYRRSDTIIVVSLDPGTNSAGMLSIPRDLYVTISGLNPPQRNRINAAYVFGDYYRYPGGGIALARRTVQETLGIPIHHYVAVDFNGFIKAIDALGGVDITLDKPLSDPYLTKWSFPAGPQHLNGEQALRYARIRYMDNDFQRERRQQTLLLALRDQALRPETFARLPSLLTSLWGSFKTDMSLADILALLPVAAAVSPSAIHNHIIDETMVTPYRTAAGAAVLLPKETAIRKLVDEVLQRPPAPTASTTPAAGTTTAMTDRQMLQDEKARVEILNGTNTKGLAARTQAALQAEGYQVSRIGDADRYTYQATMLIVYADKPFTRELLIQRLSIKPANVQVQLNPKAGADLRVVLGADAIH